MLSDEAFSVRVAIYPDEFMSLDLDGLQHQLRQITVMLLTLKF